MLVSHKLNERFPKKIDNLVNLYVFVHPAQEIETLYEGPVGVYVDKIGDGQWCAYKSIKKRSIIYTSLGERKVYL